MKRSLGFLALAATAAMVASAPLHARMVGLWEVSPGKQGSCMMVANFDDGTRNGVSIGLLWVESEGRLSFLAASPHWSNLHKREGDPTALQLRFDGDVDYSHWLHEAARFQSVGGIRTIMGSWGAENSDRLAEAVSRSSEVQISIGDTDLGGFDISGSAAAYRELRRCGEKG